MSRYLFLSLSLVSFMSAASLDAPAAPSNLVLIPDVHSVEISWQDNSDNETGFKIYRDGKLIKRVGENVTSYIDENLSANTEYKYEVKATNDLPLDVVKSIVDRHNFYRALVFDGHKLTWDSELEHHAQAWAEYLAKHYTQADSNNGEIPHARYFQTDKHNEDDYYEGENIAWGYPNRGFVEKNPINIDDVTVANGYIYGSVDAWASEKAYYDYETNRQKPGYENEAVGHYTQIVWKDTTKVGCAKAHSQTDFGGDWIVCRYSPPGNFIGYKPY